MLTKNLPGSVDSSDPDDAPQLTLELLADAEMFEADQFIRRLRASGPGWQAKISERLVGKNRELWETIERFIPTYESEIAKLEQIITALENGSMRSYTDNQDTTAGDLERNRQAVQAFRDGIEIMHRTQVELLLKPSAN